MKKSSVKITRYISGKFYVDIVEKADSYEAWIGHNDIGAADLMFGISKDQTNHDEFLYIVEANLPDYKSLIIADYLK